MNITDALDNARRASQAAEEDPTESKALEAARRWDVLGGLAHELAGTWREKAQARATSR